MAKKFIPAAMMRLASSIGKAVKRHKTKKLIQTRNEVDKLISSWKQCKCIVSEKAIRKTEIRIQDGELLTYFREQARQAGFNVKTSRVSAKYPDAFTPCKQANKPATTKQTTTPSRSVERNDKIGHCPYCGSKNITRLKTGKCECSSCHKSGFIPAISKEERERLQSEPPKIIQRRKETVRHAVTDKRIVTRSYTVTAKEKEDFRRRMNLRSKDYVKKSIKCELCDQHFTEGYRYTEREGWISYLCKSCAKQIGGPSGRKSIIYTPMGGQNKRY